MRVGVVFIVADGLTAFFVWGIWAAAIMASPIAGMLWFWYIRRWFLRRFVPSPGELPTLELEATAAMTRGTLDRAAPPRSGGGRRDACGR